MLRRTVTRRFLWGQANVTAAISDPLLGPDKGNFINGVFQRGTSGRKLYVSNPSESTIIGSFEAASIADVDAAVMAARKAQLAWAAAAPAERAAVLRSLAHLLRRDADDVARAESLCGGLCVKEALYSIHSCARTFEFFAGAVEAVPAGRVLPPYLAHGAIPHAGKSTLRRPFAHGTVEREAVGVVAMLTPFNYPLEMCVWRAAPALAAGNTAVWKVPEKTPLTAFHLGRIATEAGLPPGVLNIVQGGGDVGDALARHRGVDLVAFTGSIATGVRVQMAAAESNLKRCLLELGGNGVVIAGEDADPETVAQAAMAAFTHNGQSCSASRRLFVHASKYEATLDAIVAGARKRKLGHALDPEVEQGPLIDAAAQQRVLDAVIKATTERHAELVVGAFVPTFPAGTFVTPTVLTNVDERSPIFREELFGPVLLVCSYTSVQDAVNRANATRYGLTGAVISNDARTIRTVTRGLKCGTVWVNGVDLFDASTPFGGYRSSGYGKDLGVDALDSYSNSKTILVAEDE